MATMNYSWQQLGSATLYSGITICIDGILSSQSTANNTSTIQLRFRNSGSWWRTTSGTAAFTGTYTDSASCATYPDKINDGDTIFIITKTVTHSTDGTKSINVGGTLNAIISGSTRTATISNVSVTLPTIKRASVWSSSMLSMDDVTGSFRLPITKYVSSYYDVVEIKTSNNNQSVRTINGASSTTNYTFTSSQLNTIYGDNVSTYPLKFKMTLKTYTDSGKTTQVGNSATMSCEAYIVGGNPTLTVTTAEQDSGVVAFLGSSTSSKVIKNASDLLFTVVVSPKNSATVSNVKINGNLATLSSGTTYTYRMNNLTTGTFNIVVTDSRGKTASSTVSKTLLDYVALNFNSFTAVRVNQTSSNIKVNANISCYSSSINGTTNTPTVKYSTNGSSWTTLSSSSYTFSSNKITISNLTINNLFDYQTPGTFYLKVTDLLGTIQNGKTIPVGIYTMAKGDRKVRINGSLEIADSSGSNRVNVMTKMGTLETGVTNATATISSGTNKRSIKYGNGLLINTMKITKSNISVSNAWGNIYASGNQSIGNYQTAFTELYSVNITCYPQLRSGEIYNFWYMLTASDESLTAPPNVQFLRGTSGTVSAIIYVTAIGKWK